MPRGVKGVKDTDARVRAAIKTGQIINRLTDFVNGKVEMTSPQVTAALGLLKKSLPDLQSVKHGGDKDNPIEGVLTLRWKEPTSS
ncbi:MAG: hypothetical protein MI753_08415 [Hyphomicrobiales bacterium]|nr:hypothetical protein [Hyphomicrobiales bacterium]